MINGAHMHLVLNHIPFLGSAFAVFLLVIGYIVKSQHIKQSGLILIILSGLLTIPSFESGESAEEVLEAIGQKNEALIHEHEEAAEKAIWVMAVTAAFAVASLYMQWKKIPAANKLTTVTLILSLLTMLVFMRVNNEGGKIRHSEIRDGNPALNAPATEKDDD